MDTCYFLKEDLEGLEKEISKLEKDYKRWGKASTEQGGVGDWHDNAAYEEGMRQMGMIGKRIQELKEIKSHAQIVTPQKSTTGKVIFGSRVTIEYEDTGEVLKLMISSYISFREKEAELVEGYKLVSYVAPLAKAIIGKEIDDSVAVVIGGNKSALSIVDVE
jgi:transcription elongation factor GreA